MNSGFDTSGVIRNILTDDPDEVSEGDVDWARQGAGRLVATSKAKPAFNGRIVNPEV
jgi:hypothetical protein